MNKCIFKCKGDVLYADTGIVGKEKGYLAGRHVRHKHRVMDNDDNRCIIACQ